MEYLYQYLTFLAESVTVLVVVLLIVGAVASAAARGRGSFEPGHIDTRSLNEHYDGLRDALREAIHDEKSLKKLRKAEAKQEKQRAKADDAKRGRTWVLRFDGDVQASAVRALRNEISAILAVAEEGDEVVACIESPGGVVHGYGLAASQLLRIRTAGLRLVVAVDKVAASGGYMMAVLADRIVAAPFAIIGSIGVVAQVPNVHRLLKRHDVDVEIITAGEFKRTLTVFGENTDKAREKFVEEIEDVHAMFKEHVAEHRPALDIAQVATGEAWYGRRALELGLVDELGTSDAFLGDACAERDVIEVRWTEPRSPVERLTQQAASAVATSFERLVLRWRDRSNWTG